MPAYAPSTKELTVLVDQEVRTFLNATEHGLERSSPLLSEIGDLVSAGGKRIRPAFCYWGYRAVGGDHAESILKVAASLELLHSFALIHDDIMDASVIRRGRPTVHSRLGVGAALLVGDLALVLADDLFMTSGFAPDVLKRAFDHYSRMRQEVIVGQFMDLDMSGKDDVTEEDARLIARMKSGRYSVREPLLIGTALGGSTAPDEALIEFGECAGEAFQLRDDLLGSFGDAAELGKPVDADIREGKKNILFAKTVARLTGSERDYFLGRWGTGDDLSTEEIERLRSLISVSGALAETEAAVGELVARAESALSTARVEEVARAALGDLLDQATRWGS
ncbi:MAG: polyprenyl synthetase family protein [Actinomycetota bacterium]|nr:polyprenyl synthetase family protein [Actinomycetota bacterium]